MKNWMLVPSFVMLVAAGLAGGCSDDTSNDPTTPSADGGSTSDSATTSNDGSTATDSATQTDSATATDAATGGCNTLTSLGSQVAETAGSGTKPTPQGGTLADGTYVLTKHEVFPPSSPDANTRQRTFKFEAGKLEVVLSDANKPESRQSGTFTTSGTSINIAATCPQAGNAALPYTATGTTLIMFDSANQDDVFTYTKQ